MDLGSNEKFGKKSRYMFLTLKYLLSAFWHFSTRSRFVLKMIDKNWEYKISDNTNLGIHNSYQVQINLDLECRHWHEEQKYATEIYFKRPHSMLNINKLRYFSSLFSHFFLRRDESPDPVNQFFQTSKKYPQPVRGYAFRMRLQS